MNVEAIKKVIESMASHVPSEPCDQQWHDCFVADLKAALTEPEDEPLTEETPLGFYWWFDGKQERNCIINIYSNVNGEFRINHPNEFQRHQLMRGYVVPIPAMVGPVIPPPIQGEKPVPGVVTTPEGRRFHGSQHGNQLVWDTGEELEIRDIDIVPSGYKWEVCER